MGGTIIQEVEEEKDLGVWCHKSLKQTTQCKRAAKNANMTLGMILRSFHFRTKDTLVSLFKTFVRSKLEFSVGAWSPWTKRDEEILENEQKRMIRSISDCRGRTYEEKLLKVGLTTLAERRKRGDLIEAYKTLRGINNMTRDDWFEIRCNEVSRPTRANTVVEEGVERKKTKTMYKKAASGEIRNNFYTIQVVRPWNELPEEVKTAGSVNAFKSAYDKWTKENQT